MHDDPNALLYGTQRRECEITLTGPAAMVAGFALMETRMRAENTWLASVLDGNRPHLSGPLRSDHFALIRWCLAVRAREGSLMCSALAASLDVLVDEIDTEFPDYGYEIHAALWEIETLADVAAELDGAQEAGR